jgi:hypothetical protein
MKWIVALAIIILLTFSRENKMMHDQINSAVVKPMEYFI